jgi:hypothetical protein
MSNFEELQQVIIDWKGPISQETTLYEGSYCAFHRKSSTSYVGQMC